MRDRSRAAVNANECAVLWPTRCKLRILRMTVFPLLCDEGTCVDGVRRLVHENYLVKQVILGNKLIDI